MTERSTTPWPFPASGSTSIHVRKVTASPIPPEPLGDGVNRNGQHFCMSIDRKTSRWVYPAEIPMLGDGWKDTVGMTSREFTDWMHEVTGE
jgi:hypothetical protein